MWDTLQMIGSIWNIFVLILQMTIIFNHYVYFGIEIPYIVACIDIFVES
jgi:hypothetical protein